MNAQLALLRFPRGAFGYLGPVLRVYVDQPVSTHLPSLHLMPGSSLTDWLCLSGNDVSED